MCLVQKMWCLSTGDASDWGREEAAEADSQGTALVGRLCRALAERWDPGSLATVGTGNSPTCPPMRTVCFTEQLPPRFREPAQQPLGLRKE